MKRGSLLGKFLYLFCAVAGVLVGYGIVTWNGAKENIDNTKDNTLIRENEENLALCKANDCPYILIEDHYDPKELAAKL